MFNGSGDIPVISPLHKLKTMKTDTTIFLVDDNDYTLLLLGQKLKKALGCKIRLFTSAKACLKALDEDSPEIIVSDYRLKQKPNEGMNGDKLLIELKKEFPDMPVIIYSSKTDLDMELQMKRFGADSVTSGGANLFEKVTDLISSQLTTLEELSKQKKVAWGTMFTLTVLSGVFLYLAQLYQSKIMYTLTGVLFAALILRFYYLIKNNIPFSS